jgi:hypothetical protein
MKKTKKRTCRDRLRYAGFRNRRRGDPATTVAGKLFALLLALFGSAATVTAPSRGPEIDRERGEGGSLPVLRPRSEVRSRYRVTPSYRRLILDLRRPAACNEAANVLRRRAPAEALPWLNAVLADEDYNALAVVARAGVPDETVELRMLQETLAWIRRKEASTELEAAGADTSSTHGFHTP